MEFKNDEDIVVIPMKSRQKTVDENTEGIIVHGKEEVLSNTTPTRKLPKKVLPKSKQVDVNTTQIAPEQLPPPSVKGTMVKESAPAIKEIPKIVRKRKEDSTKTLDDTLKELDAALIEVKGIGEDTTTPYEIKPKVRVGNSPLPDDYDIQENDKWAKQNEDTHLPFTKSYEFTTDGVKWIPEITNTENTDSEVNFTTSLPKITVDTNQRAQTRFELAPSTLGGKDVSLTESLVIKRSNEVEFHNILNTVLKSGTVVRSVKGPEEFLKSYSDFVTSTDYNSWYKTSPRFSIFYDGKLSEIYITNKYWCGSYLIGLDVEYGFGEQLPTSSVRSILLINIASII